MNAQEFKEQYNKNEKWIQAENTLKQLSKEQRTDMQKHLEYHKEHFGLNFREEFYYSILKAINMYF